VGPYILGVFVYIDAWFFECVKSVIIGNSRLKVHVKLCDFIWFVHTIYSLLVVTLKLVSFCPYPLQTPVKDITQSIFFRLFQ